MKFARNDKRKIRANVELTPLIDVVFQLLIFFMLSSTFVVQSSIPIEEPESKGATDFEHKQLAITLQYGEGGPGNKGRVLLNEIEVTDLRELTNALTEFHRNNPEDPVLIRADKRVDIGRVVEILGVVTSVGIQKYGIAAREPQAEQ